MVCADLSTSVIEHALNLGGERGHDGGVEQEIETCEDDTADYYTDDDLHTSIDIALTRGGLDGGSCRDDCGIDLVLDGVDELFHRINYLVLSLNLFFVFLCLLRFNF